MDSYTLSQEVYKLTTTEYTENISLIKNIIRIFYSPQKPAKAMVPTRTTI